MSPTVPLGRSGFRSKAINATLHSKQQGNVD